MYVQGMIANSHLAQADANPEVSHFPDVSLCQLGNDSLAGVCRMSLSKAIIGELLLGPHP